MKKLKVLMLGLSVVCLMLSGVVYEAMAEYEDGVLPALDITATATMDVYNKYMWRGFTLDTDPVVQPGVALSGYGFSVLYWSNFDADSNDGLSSAEVDFTVDYTKEFEYAKVSLGHTNYDFPAAATYSKEWYVGVALPEVMLSPKVTYYNDYGKEAHGGGDGQYVNLGISHSLVVISDPEIKLDLAASVGFNDKLFIKGNGGDYLLTAGLTVPLTKSATLSPKLGYAVPFGDLKASGDGNQKARTFGGVSLVIGF